MYELEKPIYTVWISAVGKGKADSKYPDRLYLAEALDCARAFAKEGRYVKILREKDGVEVWNSVDY